MKNSIFTQKEYVRYKESPVSTNKAMLRSARSLKSNIHSASAQIVKVQIYKQIGV